VTERHQRTGAHSSFTEILPGPCSRARRQRDAPRARNAQPRTARADMPRMA
jgi:hypothetical protein